MESKRTAVDILYYWLCINREATGDEWFSAYQEAKEMEKEQIKSAHINGQSEWDYGAMRKEVIELSKQYYNETYGKKTDRS